MTAQDLEQQIERTREHLGQTVDELAAKADVKARAQARAAEVTAQTQVKAAEMTARAQAKAAEVTAGARDRAAEVTGRLRQSQVVQRRWPVAVAAGVLVAGVAVAIWRRKRA